MIKWYQVVYHHFDFSSLTKPLKLKMVLGNLTVLLPSRNKPEMIGIRRRMQ